jgi:hypothetical protein
MTHPHRPRRGRHAARLSLRGIVLGALGLLSAVLALAVFSSPFVELLPLDRDPATDPAALDAARLSQLNGVSRDQIRSAQPDPSGSLLPTASPGPSPSARRKVTPVAGLTLAQMANATIVVDVGRARGLPTQAYVVAVACALQESNLRNLASPAVPASLRYPHEGEAVNYDSIGLFQQRVSMGWGTVAQLMEPRSAAARFYDKLIQVPGWQAMSVTDAAQSVQKSAFPSAYQKHAERARVVVDALT